MKYLYVPVVDAPSFLQYQCFLMGGGILPEQLHWSGKNVKLHTYVATQVASIASNVMYAISLV